MKPDTNPKPMGNSEIYTPVLTDFVNPHSTLVLKGAVTLRHLQGVIKNILIPRTIKEKRR